jgi:hypothetical protein
MKSGRPFAVLLCAGLLFAFIMWNALSAMSSPDIRTLMLCSAVILVPGGIGAFGFWLMRWWTFFGLAIMSLALLLLVPFHDDMTFVLAWSLSPLLAPAVVAAAYRKRFTW